MFNLKSQYSFNAVMSTY